MTQDRKPGLVDVAVNLCDQAFAKDREEVLDRAQAAGVDRMLVTSSSLEEAEAAVALAAAYPHRLRATAGVHPHQASRWDASHPARLATLVRSPEVIALGETGLDYNRDFSPREAQRRAFRDQLAIAADQKMPLLMHQRDAHEDFMTALKTAERPTAGRLLHCFTGSAAQLEDCLAEDLYIGITGWVCDERRGRELAQLLTRIPLDRLLLETDSPYLLPRTLRPRPPSRRNEPCHLAHIASFVAARLELSPKDLAARATANAEALFGPWD